MAIKICKICGKSFETKTVATMCSETCRDINYQNKIKAGIEAKRKYKPCVICGKLFSERGNQYTCGAPECKAEYRKRWKHGAVHGVGGVMSEKTVRKKTDPKLLDKAAAEAKELVWSYGYYVYVRDSHTADEFKAIKKERMQQLKEEREARKNE